MTKIPEIRPNGIATPGTAFGPCHPGCDHIACEAMRHHAAADCGICGEIIGYAAPFLYDPTAARSQRRSHARCLNADMIWNYASLTCDTNKCP